ncbi:Hypothetical predicted protein [Marmota monax]|uniref:Uncharacterized protein n=1 Tax=Marmota monax TaxID=9995 RepID=A0A5E4A654_MARMO|nr:hypothetical protein GHT09_016454 [Marmota monax]VTJ52727.1 Hypothetical predicted protein [Marmota monax]
MCHFSSQRQNQARHKQVAFLGRQEKDCKGVPPSTPAEHHLKDQHKLRLNFQYPERKVSPRAASANLSAAVWAWSKCFKVKGNECQCRSIGTSGPWILPH